MKNGPENGQAARYPLPATALTHELDRHRVALGNCQRCKLGVGIRPVISRATNARVMLIGQAPGKVESEGGMPFSGRAGKTLFRWLARAGLDEDSAREGIYISAVTRCYPGAHPSGRGDRVPTRDEQAGCDDWLQSELRIIRPELLIPVGRLAIEKFLPALPLSELIGTERMVEHAGGCSLVIPLPHPSGASSWIHDGDNKLLVDRAIALIGTEVKRLVASATSMPAAGRSETGIDRSASGRRSAARPGARRSRLRT